MAKFKTMLISPEVIIAICQDKSKGAIVARNMLPNDAKYVRTYLNDNTGWGYIGIVIESKEFPEVKNGDPIPYLPNPIFEKR
jgi:hypothetical protein